MSEDPKSHQELLKDLNVGGNLTTGDISQISNSIYLSSPRYTPSYHLPYPPSPNFSGREGLLAKLHDRLPVASCAIIGMPGVGKTELALQYASKYGKSYGGGSYWLGMRDRDLATVLAQHVKDGFSLDLPPEKVDKKEIAQWCWRQWERNLPENSNVLVVLDNVDEASQIGGMLTGSSCFRLLVTTRKQALDATFAEELLEEFTDAAALKFLEKLVGGRANQEPDAARRLCHEFLGNLPLGIELAGRYLQQDSELSIADFVSELSLLHESLDVADAQAKYPTITAERGVRLALELSWQKLGAGSQTVAKLLGWCALQAIPWELATEMAVTTGETEATVRQARQQLANLHLIKWDTECKAATLHTLVRDFLRWQSQDVATLQQVFVDTMWQRARKAEQQMTLEQLKVLRDVVPHIEEVAIHYADLLPDNKFVWVFLGLARFYESQGLYAIAQPWCAMCLKLAKQRLGDNHLYTASSLNNLAELYRAMGKYTEAEPLHVRALAICEKQLGANHPDTAIILNSLAELYRAMGKYPEAEPLYVRALAIREEQLGANHPYTSTSLNNLALFYGATGKYTEAELLYVRALAICIEQLGANHPYTASSLNNLAELYRAMGKHPEAEPLHVRALAICEKQLGANHPYTASSLNHLAALYGVMGKHPEAEPLYVRALTIREEQLGANHPSTAISLNNLAELYRAMGKHPEAEPLYVRALAICEEQLGANHPSTATILNNLALFYGATGKYTEAEKLSARALSIRQNQLGDQHPDTKNAVVTAKFLHMQNLLQCDQYIVILQALAENVQIPNFNMEVAIEMINVIESNPDLLAEIQQELLQQSNELEVNKAYQEGAAQYHDAMQELADG